jgi:rSAM/selenodomain-associated transferase 2
VKVGVVIPALDEADEVAAAVASARAEGAPVWVVDGGSRDATCRRAEAAGARVVTGPRGRAAQLQAGVAAAEADALVLLHADTRLPAGWRRALEAALADPRVVGGAFRLRFDRRTPGLRVVEWGAHLRAALFRLPYGDQALFVRRAVLEAVGGIPQAPIMEDLDLVRALGARGRLALLPLEATTSARRYLAGGVWRTMWRHWTAAAGWRLGVDRARIAAWYRR